MKAKILPIDTSYLVFFSIFPFSQAIKCFRETICINRTAINRVGVIEAGCTILASKTIYQQARAFSRLVSNKAGISHSLAI